MAEKKSALLKYKTTLEKSVFDGCPLSYSDFNGSSIVQPVKSLVNFLDKAEGLGIPMEDLSQVFIYYTEQALPALKGQISNKKSQETQNYYKILNYLKLKSEKTKI